MKELKILAIVIFFTIVTYIGVEPFAHSKMHKHVDGHDFVYDGTADVEEYTTKIEDAKKKIEENTKKLEEEKDEKKIDSLKKEILSLKESIPTFEKKEAEKKAFWAGVKKIASLKGDATAGEATFAMCLGCHNGSGVNMGGVVPPSLEHAGALYDKNYLIALVKDPAMASNVDHKYADTMTHPMGSIKTMVTTDQDIANVVAYLLKNKAGEITAKEAFVDACGRCHANRYGKWTQAGFVPKTKSNIKTGQDINLLKFKQKVATEQEAVSNYMGKLPPDLSIIIRARSEHFLSTFVENPQSDLPGTAMPRTGLTKEGFEKVTEYLGETGDPSAKARAELGPKVIIFFIIFTILAVLWKKSVWKELH